VKFGSSVLDGYEDPAYFSPDYKTLFGAPPQRDISNLRSNLAI